MRIPKIALITAAVIPSVCVLSVLAFAALHHPTTAAQHVALHTASTTRVPNAATLGTTTAAQSPTSTATATAVQAPASTSAQPSTSAQSSSGTSNLQNPPSNPASTSQPSGNQSGTEQTITLHIGGYPPAISAALTPDFENPLHVPCSGQQYPSTPSCDSNSYHWIAAKYCIFTYADNHTQKQVYQYEDYPDIYANADGTLNPSGINMAVTSTPTYSCDIAHAPPSVFEPNYTY